MKTDRKIKLPPSCPSCHASDSPFVPRQREVEQVFRGESLKVTAAAMACAHCGFAILVSGQADELFRKVADAYREKHALLSADEIVARRKAQGMTQKQFAAFLNVGIASVKRWEKGYVQDHVSDRRIREKTEQSEQLVQNILRIYPQLTLRDRELLGQAMGASGADVFTKQKRRHGLLCPPRYCFAITMRTKASAHQPGSDHFDIWNTAQANELHTRCIEHSITYHGRLQSGSGHAVSPQEELHAIQFTT